MSDRAFMVAKMRLGVPYDGDEATYMVDKMRKVVDAIDTAAAAHDCTLLWDGVDVHYRDGILPPRV